MPISPELFKAILALDSYNRGYGAGIELTGTEIGNATIGIDSSVIKDTDDVRRDIPAGFYAIAYSYNGQTIISYRGTNADTAAAFANDALHGYFIGGGAPIDPQSSLAIDFYKAVADQLGSSPHNANITLTGHSLGGGLAGYIGAIYGKNVVLFDNMTYTDAVNNLYALMVVPSPLRDRIYGGAQPWLPVFTGTAYNTTGELLQELLFKRALQSIPSQNINSYAGISDPLNLHDMGLLINLMYAKENSLTDWHSIGTQFYNSFFDDQIGLQAGFTVSGINGAYGAAQKMHSAIAYSAIDSGTTVFGNTAIRAMFDDANDLGKAIGKYSSSSSSALKGASQAISNILVQFAGQLANGHVLTNIGDPLLSGVLSLSADKNTLNINLDPVLWSIGTNSGQPVADIIGRDQILNTLTSTAIDYMGDLWISTNYDLFDHVTFATKDKGITANLLDVPSTGKADLYIGGNGGDSVTGSSGNDLINGGKGLDYLYGGAGDDIIMGNDGNDTLSGGAGHNILDGGAGSNSVIYSLNTTDDITLVLSSNFANSASFNDALYNIKDVYSGSGNDYLTGDSQNNVLAGFIGNDTIDGAAGNDYLYGGDGSDILIGGGDVDNLYGGAESDTLTGGGGNDIFHIDSGDGFDIITDPEAGDSIQFSSGALSGTASKLGNDIFQLGGYNLRQQGTDLVITKNASAYGSQSATGVTIQNFFTSGYDPKLSYSNIGITIPGTDTPVTNNEKSIVDLSVQAIPGDNVRYCPIVLDLNGDGIKYKSWTSIGYNVHFDIDNDGFAEGMEWLDANDGFLVRDLNGNGKIDNGAELFGEDGGTTAYYKLAQYDTNHDNKVDANDSGFSGLRIWQDLNSNGKTEAGELKTLAQANIKELSLQLTNNQYDPTPHIIAGTSSFTRTDNSVGLAEDTLLVTAQLDTIYVGADRAVNPAIDQSVLALPLTRGYGTLKGFQYALTDDATLKAMVVEFANLNIATQMHEVYDRVDAIIHQWSSTNGLPSTGADTDSNASKAAVIQKITDMDTTGLNIDDAYGILQYNLVSKLLVQGPLRSVFPQAYYDYANDALVLGQSYDDILTQAKKKSC